MKKEAPSYEALEQRLARAEKALEALRSGEVDAVLGKERVFVLRLQEAEEEARRRTALVEGINRIFHEALTCETEEALGRVCLAVAEDLTRSGLGFIGELDERSGRMNLLSISDAARDLCRMHDASEGRSRLLTGLSTHGLNGRVLRDGRALFTNDPASHPDSAGIPAGHPELTSFLGVPLMHAGRVLGMMGLGNRAEGYGPKDLELVEALAPAVMQAFLSKRGEDDLRRANERTQEAAAKLSAVIHQMTEGVVVFDREGRLVDMNRAALAIHRLESTENLGAGLEDLAGIFDLFDLQDRLLRTTEWPISRALQGETFEGYEVRVRRRDTGETWFACYGGTPVLDREGRSLCFIVTLRDVTAWKRAEEELELRVQQRTAELATSEKRAREEAERRRHLAKRLVKLLEEDRRQTAMMLHDDVGQTIAGAKMQVENLQRDLKTLEPHQSAQFEHVGATLAQAIARLRGMSRQLHPSSLESLGLVPALQSFREQIPLDGCRLRFFFHGVPESLDYELELAVFRIAQEAVSNAVRHAGCREIYLSLITRDEVLHLIVEDDGCGFVWEQAVSRVSGEGPLGLMIIRERAVYAGGELHVDSAPDKGTTVVVELPVRTGVGS